jgi:hypothetical protein
MFDFQYFPDRTFALGAGIYIGSWGVHIYLDFWKWCLSFESNPKPSRVPSSTQEDDQNEVGKEPN